MWLCTVRNEYRCDRLYALQGLEHGCVVESAPGGIDGALRAYDAFQVLHRARQGRHCAWKSDFSITRFQLESYSDVCSGTTFNRERKAVVNDGDVLQGSISSRHIVVVRPSYPVDGLPATVQILSLAAAAARDPTAAELNGYPGPLVKGNADGDVAY